MMRSLALIGLLLLVANGGCMDDADTPATSLRTQDLDSAMWTNIVGVHAIGASLYKTKLGKNWNAGASSARTLSGDGYVEFTTDEVDTAKLVGLSTGDSGVDDIDVDFGIFLKATGVIGVRENGVNRGGSLGTYVAGDVFRVEVVSGVVRYRKNGALLYTSLGAPSFPLRVDTSLFTPGATIVDVTLGGVQFWQNPVGVTVVGNALAKTAPQDTWKAGASSVDRLWADGYLEFTTGENDAAKMVGLGYVDSDQSQGDIDFALFLKATGVVGVFEGGVVRAANLGQYAPGDVFRVEVSGGKVNYRRNGALLYTSTVMPTFPLYVDTSLRTPGATVEDVDLRVVEGPLTFEVPGDYVVPKSGAIAIGDLNEDGQPDLAACLATTGSADVGVLLGNGNGTFRAAAIYPTGAPFAACDIEIADLSGDGKPDLVASVLGGGGQGIVAVLLGNGDGSFPTSVLYGAGADIRSVSVGDLDGDGALDVAVADHAFAAPKIWLLLGNGDGTLQSAVGLIVAEEPSSLETDDLDGDGDLDLATTSYTSGGLVQVLLGNGDGTFQAPQGYPAGNGPYSVAIGDLDGDAVPDLVVGNNGESNPANISILLGVGDGTFDAPVQYAADSDSTVAIADLDLDGAPDLTIVAYNQRGVAVRLGNGDGTFGEPIDYAAGRHPRAVAAGDLDNDGRPDIVLSANRNNDTVTVVLQR